MVKQKFASLAKGCICPPDFPVCVCGKKSKGKVITRKPILPSEEELEEKLAAAINQYGSDNIFTISLEGRYQPKEPYDRARLLALGNVADVKDGTMPDYNLVALLDEHKDDMIGMYLEEFLKEPAGTREQKALYCGLEALLNAVQKTQ